MSDDSKPRMFKIGKNKKVQSFNLHIASIDALDYLASKRDINMSELVGIIIDDYLTSMVYLNKLKPPKSDDDKAS